MVNPLRGKKTDILSSFAEFFITLDTHLMSKYSTFWRNLLFEKNCFEKKKILYTCTIMHNNRYRVTKLNLYTILFHTIWTKNLFMSTWFTKIKNIRSIWNCTSVQKKMKISKSQLMYRILKWIRTKELKRRQSNAQISVGRCSNFPNQNQIVRQILDQIYTVYMIFSC